MPAVRNIPARRSRRLSKQDPYKYDREWETLDTFNGGYSPRVDVAAAAVSSSVSPAELSSLPSAFVPTASHARKRKQGHIPRPPNAFMIFRSDMWRKQKLTPNVERDHRHVSVIAGLCWKNLTPEEQKPYQMRADVAKQRHILENPGYKYSPVSRKQKSAKRKVRNDDKDKERCQKVASLMMKGFEGAALETAVNMGCEELPPNIDAPNTLIAAPVVPSTSRSRRRSSRLWHAYKDLTSPTIKLESPATPVLNSEREPSIHPDFVPTSEIPQLDLSAPASVAEKARLDDAFDYNLQPPNFTPSYVDPHFGIKPEAVEFTQSYLLSMQQGADEQPESFYSNDLFCDPDYNLSSLCNPIFDFPNPFSTPVYNDTASALLEHQRLYDEPIAPNAIDPFAALTDDAHSVHYGFWV